MKVDNLAFIVDGPSSSKLFSPFESEMNQYFPIECTKLALVDILDPFRQMYEMILQHVKEDYIIFHKDSHLFYDIVDLDMFQYYFEFLKANQFAYLKLSRGGSSSQLLSVGSPGMYSHAPDEEYRFNLYYTIWKKSTLLSILSSCKNYQQANEYCKMIPGMYAYNENDIKRGQHHWDNVFYPFMNAAVNADGTWNRSEYDIEVENFIREYVHEYFAA